MGYTICGKAVGKFSKFLRVLSFLASFLTGLDMITDAMTLYTYYGSWQAGSLPAYFWILGAFFMVLPSLVCTIMFYCVTMPCIAIYTKGKALFCGETENKSGDREELSAWILAGIALEALPQVRDIAIINNSSKHNL